MGHVGSHVPLDNGRAEMHRSSPDPHLSCGGRVDHMIPGVYDDLSNAAYHAETDWLGSSQLKRHLPEFYKSGEPTGAMDFGTAFHSAVLGTGDPVLPVDALSWTGKAAKELQEKGRANGQVPVLTKDLPIIEAMAAAVKRHDEASRLLFAEPGRNELSVFAEETYGDTTLQVRSRYDRLLDDGTAIDLKSMTGKPGSYSISRAVIDYGYDLSAEHYFQTGHAAGFNVESLTLIMVTKEAPHYVTVVDLDEDWYARGKVLREQAIDRLLNPSMVAAYEGATGRLELPMPRWARL